MRKTVAVIAAAIAVVALLFVATEQTSPPEMTEGEIAQRDAEVKQEITNRLDLYREYSTSGDVEGVLSFWTSDARVLWPGVNLAGDAFRAFVTEVFPTMTVLGWDVELLDLFVHGDVAYCIWEWSERIQMEGEQEPELQIVNCFTRLEKEDGVWKFDRDVCGPRDAPPEG